VISACSLSLSQYRIPSGFSHFSTPDPIRIFAFTGSHPEFRIASSRGTRADAANLLPKQSSESSCVCRLRHPARIGFGLSTIDRGFFFKFFAGQRTRAPVSFAHARARPTSETGAHARPSPKSFVHLTAVKVRVR